MNCIYCGSATEVTNSRLQKRANQVWRRRHCKYCGATFTTAEAPDYSRSITLQGHSGALEPFSREKLFLSIYEACRHQKHATEAATALTDTVITKLLPYLRDATIQRSEVVLITQRILAHYDHFVAATYTAHHATTQK
ncbi:hypothetical protein KC963_05335 [Candidatus Saccharibacteria bacterium]|nr:hypothetical protein [Candidatus Saccharibacteria bacterium]